MAHRDLQFAHLRHGMPACGGYPGEVLTCRVAEAALTVGKMKKITRHDRVNVRGNREKTMTAAANFLSIAELEAGARG